MSVVTDPFDYQFKVNDTNMTRVNKLENLRLFSLGIDEYILGGIRRMVSDQFQGSGILTPRKMKSVQGGLVRVIAGEGETLELIQDISLATIPWLKVESGKTFVSFWRAMVTEDNGLPDPDVDYGFAIYDANGEYIGLHDVQSRTTPWTVSDGWVMDRGITTSADIKAQYSNAAYVRGYWKRYGGSIDTVNLSKGQISDAATFEDIDAAITTERLLREAADSALASQITTVQSNVAANTAAIVAEVSARTTAVSAVASSVTTLSARVNSRPNLIPNASGEDGTTGWGASNVTGIAALRNGWGPQVYAVLPITNNFAFLQSPAADIFAGLTYTCSGEIECFGPTPPINTYFQINWYNGVTYVGSSYGPSVTGNSSYSDNGSNRAAHEFSATAPAGVNKAYVYAVANFSGVGGPSISTLSCRQVKLEKGPSPSTPYTAEAQLTVASQASTDAYGRTRSYWSVTAVAGGRAQLTVFSDSNGGGGVDIVGNVRITGSLITTGTIIANRFLTDAGVDLAAIVPASLNTSSYTSGGGTNMPISLSSPNTLGPNGNGTYVLAATAPLTTDSAGDGMFFNATVVCSSGTARGRIYLQYSYDNVNWANAQTTYTQSGEPGRLGNAGQGTNTGTYSISGEETGHGGGTTVYWRMLGQQSAAQSLGDGTAGTNWTVTSATILARKFFSK